MWIKFIVFSRVCLFVWRGNKTASRNRIGSGFKWNDRETIYGMQFVHRLDIDHNSHRMWRNQCYRRFEHPYWPVQVVVLDAKTGLAVPYATLFGPLSILAWTLCPTRHRLRHGKLCWIQRSLYRLWLPHIYNFRRTQIRRWKMTINNSYAYLHMRYHICEKWLRKYLQRFILSVVDDGSLVAILASLLKIEILFEHRCKTITF